MHVCRTGAIVTVAAAEHHGVRLDIVGQQQVASPLLTLNQHSHSIQPKCLPDGRVAILERSGGITHVLRPGSDMAEVLTPIVPEMGTIRKVRTESPAVLNVFYADMAVASFEDIYLIVGRYSLTNGAPVYRIGKGGAVIQSLRYQLPTFRDEENSQNPSGYMGGSKIGVAGDRVFPVSSTGKVAAYRVKTRTNQNGR